MKFYWQGRYLDGKTSASQKANVRLSNWGLEITLENKTRIVWPYNEIRQTQGSYSGEPVRLERGEEPSEVLIVEDTDFLTSLRAEAPGQALKFHNPGFRRARAWLTLWAGVATLIVGLVLYRWGIPLLSDTLAPLIPVSWEQGLGESELRIMAPAEKRIHNPQLDRALGKIVSRLAATFPHCPYHFKVTVCNLPVYNAFALPGGNIVVFKDLLVATHSPEELAGVLAHEMQHVLRRHSTKRLIQDSSTGILISALSGDATGSVAFGLQSARQLALLHYSRGEEEEADREGMKAILAAGIDPKGMIGFFQDLQAKEGGKEPEYLKYVSDHPSTADRIGKLKALAAGPHPTETTPLLPDTDWKELIREVGGK